MLGALGSINIVFRVEDGAWRIEEEHKVYRLVIDVPSKKLLLRLVQFVFKTFLSRTPITATPLDRVKSSVKVVEAIHIGPPSMHLDHPASHLRWNIPKATISVADDEPFAKLDIHRAP